MDVAIVTVGDEILAGDTRNTNAAWIASQLAERGASTRRLLTIPDDPDLVAETVGDWASRFDAVVVGGGLGGTHDDVTMAAVADAFDRELVVQPAVRADVLAHLAAYHDADPETVSVADVDLDVAAWAAVPEGARPLCNPVGLSPGCVVENVYVLPGPPEEFRGTFETVAEEFDGDVVSRSVPTTAPEGSLTAVLRSFREEFDLAVGSYPSRGSHNRLTVTGRDPDRVAAGVDWLRDRVETVDDEELSDGN